MIEPVFSAKSSNSSFNIPKEAIPYINEADSAMRIGHYNDAIQYYSHALRYDHKCVPVIINLALVYDLIGEALISQEYYDKAVEYAPDNPLIRHYYAMNLMLCGDFDKGWDEMKWRAKAKRSTFYDLVKAPIWNGEDITDENIVVWTEEGIGDEILTLTMIGDLHKRNPAIITLVVSDQMKGIFSKTFTKGFEIITRSEITAGTKSPFMPTFQASISELGKQLRPNMTSFPLDNPYLYVDKKLSKSLREEYKKTTGDKPLVGISWASPKSAYPDRKGSNLLTDWAPFFGEMAKKYQFISLQYGGLHDEVAEVEKKYSIEIIEEGGFDPSSDMETFAAQVNAMDLVISVSNSTVHFAGALGKPVWNITPENVKIWYWFQHITHNPWYPTMKLFRNAVGHKAIRQAAAYLDRVGFGHKFPEPDFT